MHTKLLRHLIKKSGKASILFAIIKKIMHDFFITKYFVIRKIIYHKAKFLPTNIFAASFFFINLHLDLKNIKNACIIIFFSNTDCSWHNLCFFNCWVLGREKDKG